LNQETEKIYDITPDTELLMAQRRTNIGWKRALSELIDNSFDAGSNSVNIEYAVRKSHKKLSVSDDGSGCSDVDAMLRMGHHKKQASTTFGRSRI